MSAPLSYPAHARATLVLGLPLIGSSLAQMALHVTDTIMMGWYGVVPLAAVVLGSSSFFILFVLGSGFAKAVMPLVAEARARGDEPRIRRDARMGLWLSAGFGVAIYPVFWFADPILLALGQKPDVAAIAADYMAIAGLGIIPALAVTVLQSWLAALGRTQVVLWVTLAAVAVNVAVNWCLIFGNAGFPELGAQGAAIATVLVQVISLVLLGLYAARHPALRDYRLFQRFWRADRAALVQVFRLGWPIGLTGIAEGGLFQASALMMGWLGAASLAAHGIAMEVASVAFMLHVGLSMSGTIRVAAFAGQDDRACVRQAAVVALGLSLAVGIVVVAIFATFPRAIVSLFLDLAKPESAAIVDTAITLLMLAALFQLADAMQVMVLGLLRGLKDTAIPMALAVASYWGVGIPASYVLAFEVGLGGVGLWLGLVVGLMLAAATLGARFWWLVRLPAAHPA
jgi:multidrug resistance protein, MATE family